MGKRLRGIIIGVAGLLAASCGSSNHEPSGKSSSALYGGTTVTDPSQVGIVWLEHMVDPFNDSTVCEFGTGVLLTNDTILTAGHVADAVYAKDTCAKQGLVPQVLRITLRDPISFGPTTDPPGSTS